MRTLTSVLGNSQRLDGGAMFGNAPRAVWQTWIAPDEQHRIGLACRCLLVEDAGKRILFEAGIGTFFSPEKRARFGVVESDARLIANLAHVGVAPEDVDVVVLSHLHFDHAGGALTSWAADQPLALQFPRARTLVSREAWERAQHPHPRDRASFIPELVPLLQSAGNLEIVAGDSSPTLGEGYRFIHSHGHTPGLLLTEIATDEGPVVFASDLIPGRPWVHAPITMGYDRYPELLIDEKVALLNDLSQRGGRLFFTHDADVAMARLIRQGGKFSSDDPVAELRQWPGVAAS